MKQLTCPLLIILLLLGCLSCGEPPPSVMELIMPATGDTTEPPPEMTTATEEEATEPAAEVVTDIEPPTEVAERDVIPPPTSVDTSLLDEMQAILAVDGEVHSPIPDDIYELLWGHYTKAGSAAPRDYYTKYIDADGIAIVGGDLTEDALLQAARHIVLIMTSKLSGLREALSIHTPRSEEQRFRLVILTNKIQKLSDLPDVPPGIRGIGKCGGPFCAAIMLPIKHRPHGLIVVHEMAHAIHGAIINSPQLFPDFTERLGNEYERQQEHFRLRDEEGLTDFNGEKYPTCTGRNNGFYTGVGEYWAHFVHNWWFDELFEVDVFIQPSEERLEGFRNRCGDVVNLAEEIFPRVSIIQMMRENYW